MALDAATCAVAGAGAWVVTGAVGSGDAALVTTFVVVVALVRLATLNLFGVYRRVWRYAGPRDVLVLLAAITTATLLVAALFVGLLPGLTAGDAPVAGLRLFLAELGFSALGLGGIRYFLALKRRELNLGSDVALGEPPRRVLLYGAGELGALLAREMRDNRLLNLDPVAFVDDDSGKYGKQIYGVPVLGRIDDIPRIVEEAAISEVIVAQSRITASRYRQVSELCDAISIPVRALPGMPELLDETVTISKVRPVHVEDLLGRIPQAIPIDAIKEFVAGKRVLVTGAGGSIGSEVSRQIAALGAQQIVLFDRAETPLFFIDEELRRRHPETQVSPVLGDVADSGDVRRALRDFRPNVVLHAAAHKHVPLSETNISQAVRANVRGTRLMAEGSARAGVDAFIFISTDKAVDPSSVMGATKRLGELIVQHTGRSASGRFVIVRFGNVLGSQGSVVQLFREQIARGGPVTVTDPAMTRFFMTIPEAVRLILLAGAIGRPGDIHVLNMGQPVRIEDLARDMIRLSLPEGERDIDIVYTGLRAGEKMEERLFADDEDAVPTQHEFLLIARNASALRDIESSVTLALELEALAERGDDAGIRRRLIREAGTSSPPRRDPPETHMPPPAEFD